MDMPVRSAIGRTRPVASSDLKSTGAHSIRLFVIPSEVEESLI